MWLVNLSEKRADSKCSAGWFDSISPRGSLSNHCLEHSDARSSGDVSTMVFEWFLIDVCGHPFDQACLWFDRLKTTQEHMCGLPYDLDHCLVWPTTNRTALDMNIMQCAIEQGKGKGKGKGKSASNLAKQIFYDIFRYFQFTQGCCTPRRIVHRCTG